MCILLASGKSIYNNHSLPGKSVVKLKTFILPIFSSFGGKHILTDLLLMVQKEFRVFRQHHGGDGMLGKHAL